MIKYAVALTVLFASIPAFADCPPGNGGVPFSCTKAGPPSPQDLLLGGQNGKTVSFSFGQLLQMDFGPAQVTSASSHNAQSLASWMDYFTGTPIPYPVRFGNTVVLSADPASAMEPATKQYADNLLANGVQIRPPPTTGWGTMNVTNTSIEVNSTNMTEGINSPAWAMPLVNYVTVEVRAGSAGSAFFCPYGGACTQAAGIEIMPGMIRSFYLSSSVTNPTVISPSGCTVELSW